LHRNVLDSYSRFQQGGGRYFKRTHPPLTTEDMCMFWGNILKGFVRAK